MKQMHSELLSEIQQAFSGQSCWGVSAGSPRGYSFVLKFGGRLHDGLLLQAGGGSDDVEDIHGELELFVTCEWDLYRDSQVVTDYSEDNSADGTMVAGLKHLVGEILLAVFFDDTRCIFDFSSGYHLVCDMDSQTDEKYVTIMFFHGERCYGISKDGSMTIEG